MIIKLIRSFLVLGILFFSPFVYGQYVKGKLTDESGSPLPFANVYVKESTYGVSTDAYGKYFLELKNGNYTIVFSYLGYENKEIAISMKSAPIIKNVQLGVGAIELQDIEIVANKRDRAKYIMKQVRNQRSELLDAVNNYQCNTYLKTSLEKELKRPSKKDTMQPDSVIIKEGENVKKEDLKNYFKKEKLNLIETISTTYFESPGKYKEVIEAHHDYAERKPDNGNSASVSIELNEGSIVPQGAFEEENPYLLYQDVSSIDLNFYKNYINYPTICSKPILSPIASTSALSYTYTYIRTFPENGKKVHELEFKAINKAEPLFYGTLFIEDSTWALITIDAQINEQALMYCNNFRVIQNYDDIDSLLYVPVRREINYTIKDGKYDILGNTRVDHSKYIINQEIEKGIFNSQVKEFNVDAFDKDSTFWATERKLTLKDEELEYIKESDSISDYYESAAYYHKIDSAFNKINWWTPLNGYGHRNRVLGTEYYISGLFEQVVPFGIGGYRHKLPGYFNKEFDNGYKLETKGFVDYGFNNGDVKGEIKIGFMYWPKKFMKTSIKIGETYNMINGYASLSQTFSRSNYVLNRHLSIHQRVEIINGLFAEVHFLHNIQDPITGLQLAQWSTWLFGGLNTPVDFVKYTKTEFKIELLYRIKQKYYFKNNKKVLTGINKYPELKFIYRKGIPNWFGSEVNFDYLEIGASHELNLARFGNSRWQVNAGSFVNKKNLRLLEYRYFRGSDPYFFSDPLSSFQLLGYVMNTPNEYLRANYIHHFQGSILNKVPLVNKLKLELAGGAGALLIPDSDFEHIEVFAGLERVFRIKQQLFRFGGYAVTASNTIDATKFTYKFGISFFNPFTKKWDY